MKQKSDFDIAMEEFLANGGQVQQIARGVQSETATTNFWGAPKKKLAAEISDIVPTVDSEL